MGSRQPVAAACGIAAARRTAATGRSVATHAAGASATHEAAAAHDLGGCEVVRSEVDLQSSWVHLGGRSGLATRFDMWFDLGSMWGRSAVNLGSARLGPIRRSIWVDARKTSVRHRRSAGRKQPNAGRSRHIFCRRRSRIGGMLHISLTSANFGRSGRALPKSSGCRPNLAGIGLIWPSQARHAPKLARVDQTRPKVGRNR